MIIKHYQLENFNLNKFIFFLIYGKNEGLQKEIIEKKFTNSFLGEINRYEENEVLSNSESIISEILNKSLFSNNKIIIITRASDKILKIIEKLLEKKLSDIKIIIKSGQLEKKSKLRNLFEKNKDMVTMPVYQDEFRSLLPIIIQFTKKNDIKLSRESINLILDRASGSRENLYIELEKIFNYSISNKVIEFETVKKLTNLSENYGVNELANQYLSKNKKNLAKILNENNYSDEDCILILRTILSKSKRLIEIIEKNNEIENIDEVINDIRPPIFWKEKDDLKKQVNMWDFGDLKNKIYRINEIEALIKSNSKNSLNILSDFIVNY
jgi:DNA polymerase-3 subunit delta|tara:strand:+ start:119 stop:1096 length:978 start_codon:yes stop_codon:yes gene_type:complete